METGNKLVVLFNDANGPTLYLRVWPGGRVGTTKKDDLATRFDTEAEAHAAIDRHVAMQEEQSRERSARFALGSRWKRDQSVAMSTAKSRARAGRSK